MSVGYSGTPLPRKLGIKEGSLVAALWAPEHFASLLVPLPHGVRLRTDLRGRTLHDVLVAFVATQNELRTRFDRARAKLDPHGGLWIAWPKRSSALAKGLKESHVRQHGLSTGLVDNKICAIDEDWSALRFVLRIQDRPPRDRGR
jgi:hypothetical protein